MPPTFLFCPHLATSAPVAHGQEFLHWAFDSSLPGYCRLDIARPIPAFRFTFMLKLVAPLPFTH